MTERQPDDTHTLSRRMVAAITNFEAVLADLVALVLESASSQSASGVVVFADDLQRQLTALSDRVAALERQRAEPDQPWRNEP